MIPASQGAARQLKICIDVSIFILFSFSANYLSLTEKSGQKNLQILVGQSVSVNNATVCGQTSNTRMALQVQEIDCNPQPILGRYVTIRTTELAYLVIGEVKIKLQEYGYEHY